METKKITQLLMGALMLAVLPAQAAVLYGVQLGNQNLVTVDTVTGAIANVGLLPGGSNSLIDSVQGLTGTAGGNLLYTDGNTLSGVQVLNPANAASITTFALPVQNRGGLSFDTAANSLYSVNNGAPIVQQAGLGGALNLNFANINPSFPGAIGGDDNGRHFAQGFIPGGPAGIHEFNALTGVILNSLPIAFQNTAISGLAFDGAFLYASALNSNQLYTLNPNTGAIVSQVTYAGGSLTALASLNTNVPLPATLALLGLGLAGIGYQRRKQVKAA